MVPNCVQLKAVAKLNHEELAFVARHDKNLEIDPNTEQYGIHIYNARSNEWKCFMKCPMGYNLRGSVLAFDANTKDIIVIPTNGPIKLINMMTQEMN